VEAHDDRPLAEHPLHLPRGCPAWPPDLEAIDAPPDALWARGRIDLLTRGPRIAVVGTRAPSAYGLDQARRFAGAFAAAGLTVVSGLARGIDATAHGAALERGGATLAVLGCGVDRPWPEGPLAERMAREGLLLAELAPGTPPRRHHFPSRNRLISALSAGVLVVEAAERSGSLITARWAADQGREVWVVPGRVDEPMARGCLRLLDQGARCVVSPADVLADLGARVADGSANEGADAARLPTRPLLEALDACAAGADDLARRLGRPLLEVLAELAELELDGRVARAPGGLYRRCDRGDRHGARR